MLGRNHVVLSLASVLLLAIPWLPGSAGTVALVLAGVWIGAYLPDLDTPNMRIVRGMMTIPLFPRLARKVLFAVVGGVFWILRIQFHPEHRGSLHTFLGIAIYSAVICGSIYAILQLSGYWNQMYLWLFAGLAAGGVCHLVEDSCTRFGVRPFTPFWQHRFRGGITTGSGDLRPEIYGSILFCFVAALGYLNFGLHLAQDYLVTVSLLVLVTAWGSFWFVSKFPGRSA